MTNKVKIILKIVISSIIVYGIGLIIWLKIGAGFLKYILIVVISLILNLIISKLFKEEINWESIVFGTLLIVFFVTMAVVLTSIFLFHA